MASTPQGNARSPQPYQNETHGHMGENHHHYGIVPPPPPMPTHLNHHHQVGNYKKLIKKRSYCFIS